MAKRNKHRRSRARRRAAVHGAAATLGISLTGVALVMTAQAAPTLTVAKDGSGSYRTVQAAIDAAGPGDIITVAEGIYHEAIRVPRSKRGLTIEGETGDAEDVVITQGRARGGTAEAAGPAGRAGGPTAVLAADDLTVTDLTVSNTSEGAVGRKTQESGAVALRAVGDRQTFRDSRFIGHQDTVVGDAPSGSGTYRQYFHKCVIMGDVDVVSGSATTVYDRAMFILLDRGAATDGLNGFLAAPSTRSAQPHGILINDSTVRSAAAADTFHLGRPWEATRDAAGRLVVRDTVLPNAVKSEKPWSDMNGFRWQDARFREYRNSGPAAGEGGSARPQLSATEAPGHTPEKYLAGEDGWDPVT